MRNPTVLLIVLFVVCSDLKSLIAQNTPDSITSIVRIGSQTWMAKDLQTSTYSNGEPLMFAKTAEEWKKFNDDKIGCYQVLPNGTYLYNGFSILDPRGICPTGFTIPTIADFDTLLQFLGGESRCCGIATRAMINYNVETEFFQDDGMENKTIYGSNSSNFNATRGGFVYPDGTTNCTTETCWDNCSFWWTSTRNMDQNMNDPAFGFTTYSVGYCSQDIDSASFSLDFGFAIRPICTGKRCIIDEEVFSFAEQMPSFPGGELLLKQYLSDSLRYPEIARVNNITGTVYVYFEVASDGSIQNVKTKKGISNHSEMNSEAERLISAMPNWTPGKNNGARVRVSMVVPVNFVKPKE